MIGMTQTTEELIELERRLRSIINDISYDALPNQGEEKLQWLNDLSTLKDMLNDIIESERVPEPDVWNEDPIVGILRRRLEGFECDEDESAVVKRYFTEKANLLSDPEEADKDPIVTHFPQEWSEWGDERNK